MGDLARLRELIAQRQARRSDPAPIAVPPAWSADPPQLLSGRARVEEEPRPDLPGSELWSALLRLASGDADDTGGVFGRLLACRACGGRLERRDGRWMLAPVLDAQEQLSIWADRAAWEADAERWLKPRSREIVALLRKLPPSEGEA